MEPSAGSVGQLVESSKRLARRLFTIAENRLELLLVEVKEERARLLHAFLLALGVAVFGFLAGVALTLVIVVWLWARSPIAALLVLASLYAAIALLLYQRLAVLRRDWQTLPATLDQLKKDRACLGKNIV
jgi:uncharacterized membrane protein YqjE